MICYIIHSYLPALLTTLAIETGVALLFGFRKRLQILAVMLVSLVTHPLLHVFILVALFFQFLPSPLSMTVILSLEAGVFLTEWFLLTYALRLSVTRAGFLALTMNLASYLYGFLRG